MKELSETSTGEVSKPNLFIIGASKCATTSMWDILRQHPDIFMSEEKEPWFFVQNNYEDQLSTYLTNFEQAKDEKYRGEASPVYSETITFPNIARRIYKSNPNARIIYTVRNPIDRLISVWRQTLQSGHWYKEVYKERYGKEGIGLMPLDFEEALFNYPPYVEASKYWTHLSNYLELFSDENVHLIFFEDFVKEPQKVINNISDFLKINRFNGFPNIKKARNQGAPKKRYFYWFGKLSKEQRRIIRAALPTLVIDRLLKKNIKTKHLFTGKLKKRVLAAMDDEIHSILEYGGKSDNFWDNSTE